MRCQALQVRVVLGSNFAGGGAKYHTPSRGGWRPEAGNGVDEGGSDLVFSSLWQLMSRCVKTLNDNWRTRKSNGTLVTL
jgi:hypothetical protein